MDLLWNAHAATAHQKYVVWWSDKYHAPTQATRRSIARTRHAHIHGVAYCCCCPAGL